MSEKKLSALERKSVERNRDAVKRDIEINVKRLEVMKKLKDVRLAHYTLTNDYKANLAYQLDAEFLVLSKKLDELKWQEEIEKLEAFIAEREDAYTEYTRLLSERA